MNNKYFKSGEEYTLANFFSNNNKIIIPDLQRDYCWGNTIGNKEKLVTEFMSSLIDLFRDNPTEAFTLGLIYGYELDNKGLKGHTHLCDGQQRITTLFLLLGILNRKTNGKFRQYLISDFELNEDGKEPYLQYAIRESTLYFLSDLVCEFFLKDDIEIIDEISIQDWYFEDYKLDASIVSMLAALKLIEEKLCEMEDLVGFGNFVCNKLQMLYYDMGTRAQGEETFVVINKTGEPLTPTENLKPRYISQLQSDQEQASKLWEECENFFWLNRTGGGKKQNDTADKGFLEFLRWIVLLNSDKVNFEEVRIGGSFSIDHLRIEEIQEYYKIVRFVFIDSQILSNKKDWLAPSTRNDQIDLFQILPIIEYIRRFGEDNIRNILRVKQFFKNRAKDGNVRRDISQMLALAIRIIKELPSADIADIVSMNGISGTLLTKEEILKFELYKKSSNREQLEDLFWKQEKHRIWNGEIMPILTWSINEDLDVNLFENYSKVFSILFHDSLEYEKLDKVRRALLTRDLLEYPKRFSSNINYSFCWEYSDWKNLINENIMKFGEFLYELLDKSEENIDQIINKMIDENPNDKDFDEFVKISKLLRYCEQKNIQYSDGQGWILIKKERRSGAHANLKSYKLFLEIGKDSSLTERGWQIWFYEYEGGRLVVENKVVDVAIDIFFVQKNQAEDFYKLHFFKRKNRDKTHVELASTAQKNKLEYNEHKSYESLPLQKDTIVRLLYNIVEELTNENTLTTYSDSYSGKPSVMH